MVLIPFLMILLTAATVYAGTGAIVGHVHDRETGDPVIGAQVVARHAQKTSIQNLDGYFELAELPAGPETLRVTALGYEPKIVFVVVVADSELAVEIKTRVGRLWNEPLCYTRARSDRTTSGRGTLRGTVTDLVTGRPIPDARVESQFHEVDKTGTGSTCGGVGSRADSNGNFVVFDIPPSVLTWSVYADGYYTDIRNATSLPDTTVEVNFHLHPKDSLSVISSVRLTGRIWNSITLRPFPGVSVTLLPDNHTALTDSQGVFELEGLAPGSRFIEISAPGFDTYLGEIALGDKPVHRIREIILWRE